MKLSSPGRRNRVQLYRENSEPAVRIATKPSAPETDNEMPMNKVATAKTRHYLRSLLGRR